jgi:putative transposase
MTIRNKSKQSLVGNEFSQLLHTHRNLITELLKSRNIFTVCKAIISIKNVLISIYSQFTLNIHALAKKHYSVMNSIVSAISRSKDSLGLEKAALFFGISRATFFSWQSILSFPCTDSPVGRCVRRWPNQLSEKAVSTMKELCIDISLKGWPLSSLSFFAKRLGILSASLGTWYKYSRLFNLRSRISRCRKKQMLGVRALFPNQIWHGDVTQFKTLDGIVHYIYLVMDNFSRRILSWDTSQKLSASIRVKTIQEAWLSCQNMITNTSSIDLFLDGGPENNNALIENFISQDDVSIRKIIAQVDVHYSNSMIEAMNKLLKYRYLFIQNIPDGEALRKHLEHFIPIYNTIRPHISLKGKTPHEVYFVEPFNEADPLSSDILSRFTPVVQNRVSCTVCHENDTV